MTTVYRGGNIFQIVTIQIVLAIHDGRESEIVLVSV